MIPATALCACGVTFFLRAVRAASQGGIEIGFHSHEALPLAAQTARGAATLLLSFNNHPEMEIDKVTTPEGCTISGLNEMEHQGFSSAMIIVFPTKSKSSFVISRASSVAFLDAIQVIDSRTVIAIVGIARTTEIFFLICLIISLLLTPETIDIITCLSALIS